MRSWMKCLSCCCCCCDFEYDSRVAIPGVCDCFRCWLSNAAAFSLGREASCFVGGTVVVAASAVFVRYQVEPTVLASHPPMEVARPPCKWW